MLHRSSTTAALPLRMSVLWQIHRHVCAATAAACWCSNHVLPRMMGSCGAHLDVSGADSVLCSLASLVLKGNIKHIVIISQ